MRNGKGQFRQGLKDGVPVALGYFSVSIAFGMMGVLLGRPVGETVLVSLTNLTSAGQFAGVRLLAAGGTLVELFLTTLIINARYFLMALSVSQKLDSKVTWKEKLLIAFGITDEIFAVSMGHKGALTFWYMMGLIALPVLGWTLGTYTGAVASSVLPDSVTSAFGIALYGMFIAIVVPAAKDHKNVFWAVALSILASCVLFYAPWFSFLSDGWSVIVVTVGISALMAFIAPIDEQERMDEDGDCGFDGDGPDDVCHSGESVFDFSQEDHE